MSDEALEARLEQASKLLRDNGWRVMRPDPFGKPGKFSAADVSAEIKKGNGKATMKTVAGGELTFTMMGKDLMVADAGGTLCKVTIADVNQSNGVIHVVDGVLLPKM